MFGSTVGRSELFTPNHVASVAENSSHRGCRNPAALPSIVGSVGSRSDHGWGNHQFVLGGAVQGGRLFGTFPTLAVVRIVTADRAEKDLAAHAEIGPRGNKPGNHIQLFSQRGRWGKPFAAAGPFSPDFSGRSPM